MVLPGSIPAIISNMKVNIGLCLVGVIIGEFLAARSGLGYLIIYSSQVFKLDWLLMSICILCIIAVLLYAIISLIEKWYLKRRGDSIDLSSRLFHYSKLPVGSVTPISKCCITVLLLLSSESP